MTKVKVSVLSPENEKEVMVDILGGDGEVIESQHVDEGGIKLFVNDSQNLMVREVGKESEEGAVDTETAADTDTDTEIEVVAPVMRAKMEVSSVVPHENGVGETLNFAAVSKSEPYDENGSDENNTYAQFTPTASLSMEVVNPALIGKIKVGEAYYLDFTLAEAVPEENTQE